MCIRDRSREIPLEQQLELIETDSSKKGNESWKLYVDRLYLSGLISRVERQKWVTGNTVRINKTFWAIYYVAEAQTSVHPDGREQTHNISIPKKVAVEGFLTLPKIGSSKDKAPAPGYKFDFEDALSKAAEFERD